MINMVKYKEQKSAVATEGEQIIPPQKYASLAYPLFQAGHF